MSETGGLAELSAVITLVIARSALEGALLANDGVPAGGGVGAVIAGQSLHDVPLPKYRPPRQLASSIFTQNWGVRRA